MANYRHTTEVMAGFGKTLSLVFEIGLPSKRDMTIRINKEKRKINPRGTINILNCKSQ